ncbi:hypothetical protein DW243_01090 [Mediterraneibacter gnavus]|uniref:FunZ protein n=1 Tax=Mediterraneibacter gnavus TaxID=33038 RepID=A0A414UZN6_MEDGN|nr:hypothetical protein [Mediterraneibacter gnavus]RHG68529.1 hypothetical protein DW248_15235 [Mediterraneibacter gnavus]RHG88224.1 hypothetical protein DW243_01090 [Mediterraneibacter gnavus]
MESVKLKDIYFGRADGLQESEEVNFENLFYKGNNKYSLLVENKNKFIISGKKGTGKTILAKYFEKENERERIPTKTLTKREFVLRSLVEKGEFDLNNYDYGLFIEYVILIEMAKIILDNKKKLLRFKNFIKVYKIHKSLKYLDKIVIQRISVENFTNKSYRTESGISTDNGYSVKVNKKPSSFEQKGNITYNERKEIEYDKNPYYNILDNLKKNVVYILGLMPVNVIFDDLDEFDDKIDNNGQLIKFLIEFIESAYKLNIEFQKINKKNSRVILLIRSDIIKILNNYSTNLNKIVSDSEIRLNWIKKTQGTEMHPLLDMICTKIMNSNKLLKNYTKEEIISQFFPVTINGVPFLDHMLNSSFGRPRDIINMLNIIKEEYPNAIKFSADYFKATQQEYSNKFIDELRNELSIHHDAKMVKESFLILQYINKKTFWLSNVKDVLEKYSDEISWFTSERQFLDFAYQYGMIGNTWKSKNENKYNFSWKYREDGHEKPDYEKRFYLHLALRKNILD